METFWTNINLKLDVLQIVQRITKENPLLTKIFKNADTFEEAKTRFHLWLTDYFKDHPAAFDYYKNNLSKTFRKLSWPDYAAIRLMDYLDHEGRQFADPNLLGKAIRNEPVKILWLAIRFGKGDSNKAFFLDMLYLFRQLNGKLERNIPEKEKLLRWMARHPSGLDKKVIEERKLNKDRIIRKIIENIDLGLQKSRRFQFKPGSTFNEKYHQVVEWWNDYRFHLTFAIRHPDLLNDMIGNSLSEKIMQRLYEARKKGIPLFVNPHYLSLLSEHSNRQAPVADKAIRDYLFPSQKLIDTFGDIIAWEKEDIIRPGEPNAAGWLLPAYYNIHRRYPEVAIFIPDTTGRACAGLCVSCQRMYDFQNGHFNFNIKKLQPKISWPEKMRQLMDYFENDTHLRDILITGGDAFMSSDESLKQILDAVYTMALRKKEANKKRKDGEKYAEIVRVRLGTRMPVYLPQRITNSLVSVLADFKDKAKTIGIQQFIIQTHIESAMEITPETRESIQKLIKAGWLIINQQVFITAASLRGHTAKLRKVLNDIGVLPYYTFSVKGFMENYSNFATNARMVQEKTEEKYLGNIPAKYREELQNVHLFAPTVPQLIQLLREKESLPFLATDRNIMNLPGLGKSLGFRTIGITSDGRRILMFKYDKSRSHSPMIKTTGDVFIIESKPVARYLKQVESMGQNIREYQTIWGYSLNETEERSPVYQYPEYDFKVTKKHTNLQLESGFRKEKIHEDLRTIKEVISNEKQPSQ